MRILFLGLLFSAQMAKGQSPEAGHFAEGMKQLVNDGLDSLALGHLGIIPVLQFDEVGWEFFNAHERENLESGAVPLNRFRALTKEDVVELRDSVAVVLLHERHGWKVRLASFTREGTPIQSFLIHDRYGYLYEKNFRAYSMDQPIHFNATENTFDFYQLIYSYEPIPTLEQPSQDPVEHQSFHQVTVNEEGLIELRYSEATGKRMFHRSKAPPVLHEVEFHELSLFTTSHANEPESALWPEAHLTHGDMDSHDTIAIPLSYGTDWQRRFFFLKPREGHSIVDVSQRHENVMTFPGDGTTCELTDWKRYTSPWIDLHCEGLFFQTEALDPGGETMFPPYSENALREAFDATCGTRNDRPSGPEPHVDRKRIVVERVVIRIRFEGPSGGGMKCLILQIANGC